MPASVLPKPAKAPASAPSAASGASSSATAAVLNTPATPIRSQPRGLRLWIAPWEDADGDLHEASVVHVLVDTGRWLIERVVPRESEPPRRGSPADPVERTGVRPAAGG